MRNYGWLLAGLIFLEAGHPGEVRLDASSPAALESSLDRITSVMTAAEREDFLHILTPGNWPSCFERGRPRPSLEKAERFHGRTVAEIRHLHAEELWGERPTPAQWRAAQEELIRRLPPIAEPVRPRRL